MAAKRVEVMDELIGDTLDKQTKADLDEPRPIDANETEDKGGLSPAGAGYGNPLGIPLYEDCHLPKVFLDDRTKMIKYAGRHFDRHVLVRMKPSANEMELYKGYLRRAGKSRPLVARMFAAVVRGIVMGKPIEEPVEPDPDTMAL